MKKVKIISAKSDCFSLKGILTGKTIGILHEIELSTGKRMFSKPEFQELPLFPTEEKIEKALAEDKAQPPIEKVEFKEFKKETVKADDKSTSAKVKTKTKTKKK